MSLGQSAGQPGRTHDRRRDDTAVGWFTWVGVWPVSQVAVFAGGERKYGSLHGRCNATHADGTGKHHSCCARIQLAVSTAQQNLRPAGTFRCVRGWVCRPQNPVGAVLGVPTWSLIRRLVVFRIPAWNSFLEIGEAETCSRDPYMIVKLRCLPI